MMRFHPSSGMGFRKAAPIPISTISSMTTAAQWSQSGGRHPAELFTSDLPNGSINRGAFGEISAKLSSLPESGLVWISALLDVALHRGPGQSTARSKRPLAKIAAKPARLPVLAKKKSR
jgi:hypothetical protein